MECAAAYFVLMTTADANVGGFGSGGAMYQSGRNK